MRTRVGGGDGEVKGEWGLDAKSVSCFLLL